MGYCRIGGLIMVIRGTPTDIEHYIKIHDQDKIIKLGKMGFDPTYIDDDFAYFEYNKALIDAIVEVIQWLDNKGV